MTVSILDAVPYGWTLRDEQREFLLAIEAGWDHSDVIAGTLPTAFGKTLVSVVIARWQAAQGVAVSYIQPDNILVEQTHAAFPDLAVLHRHDSYRCETWHQSCASTARKQKGHCKGCPYLAAKRAATAGPITLANYYVYYAHRLYSPVLIADEAHRLLDMLDDKRDIKIWRSDFAFPRDLKTVADVIAWGQEHLKAKPSRKLETAIAEIIRCHDGATVEYRQEYKRYKPDTVLTVVPAVTRAVPTWLWPPHKVRKIVLLSATIGTHDVEELGLSGRRVLRLTCPSPIPPTHRPLKYEPRCNMALKYRDLALPFFAAAVKEKLAAHPEKGLIHLPYKLAEAYREIADDRRLMFHGRENKAEVLERFRDSPPAEGRVLVASGLYEGLDLPYDAARWQVLGVVPWPNLGDDRIRRRAEADEDWYHWQAIRQVMQAYGRIVRAPDDFGTTYMFDSNFERLYNADSRRTDKMFPKFFRDAVSGRGLKK